MVQANYVGIWRGTVTKSAVGLASSETTDRISTPAVTSKHYVDLERIAWYNADNSGAWIRAGISSSDGVQVIDETKSPSADTWYTFSNGWRLTLWPGEYFFIDASGITTDDSLKLAYRGMEYTL